MGLLAWLWGPPKRSDAEIVSDALTRVLEAQVEDRRHQRQLLDELRTMHQDHMGVTQRLLEQYITTAQNERSTLDERLFKQEDEWEPIEQNPFEGLN